jgi:hypothetical protein
MILNDLFCQVQSGLPLVVGVLPGDLLNSDDFNQRISLIMTAISLGFAWLYLILQAFDIVVKALALRGDPIPSILNVSDRASVKDHLATLTSKDAFTRRCRNLLEAWSSGGSARQITELAALQSVRARAPMRAGIVFVLMLLAVALGVGGHHWLTYGALLALGFVALARQMVVNRTDCYIESHLLTKLSANIPQTAMTAVELGGVLGAAIDKAFKDHVPQPEQTAIAMKKAVDGVISSTAAEVEKLQKMLTESQSQLVQKWMSAATATTTDLKDTEKALATVVTDLTSGLSTNAEKMKNMLVSHTQSMEKAMGTVPAHMKTVLAEHNEKFQAANVALTAQLGKIAELEKEIQKILHLQESVDNALKGVAATDEFKQTLVALRTHVQESDKLLREISKPKTIRLVESDNA